MNNATQQILKAVADDHTPLTEEMCETMISYFRDLHDSPEHLTFAGFDANHAHELARKIAEELHGYYDIPSPSDGDISEEDSLNIQQQLRAEFEQEQESESPNPALGFLLFMGPIHGDEQALQSFQRYAAKRTLKERLKKPVRPRVTVPLTGRLSKKQQPVFERCVRLGDLFYSGRNFVSGFKVRCFPLIAGPTGAGKSHLVRQVAAELGCEYMQLDFGKWIPRGAKEDPNTLETVAEKVLQHERVLVHLDELDKIQGDFGQTWEISVKNEIWRLLDRPVDLSYLSAAQSFEEGAGAFCELFAERVWIVGSGTWQEVFDSANSRMGFDSSDPLEVDVDEVATSIRKSKVIAPELLARFDSQIQILTYPQVEEIIETLEDAGLEFDEPLRQKLRENLAHSGYRAVEDLVTEYSLECFAREIREQEDRPAVETSCPGEYPGIPQPEVEREETDKNLYPITLPYAHRMPPGAAPSLARIQESQEGEELQLHWYQLAEGMDAEGLIRAHVPILFTEIWDDFARDWYLPPVRKFARADALRWLPADALGQSPLAERFASEEERFTFWKNRYENGRHWKKKTELQKLIDTIHNQLQPETRRENLQEEYFRISRELMCGWIGTASSAPGFSGPKLDEIRVECERQIHEGLFFFYHIVKPVFWEEEMQACLEQWERRLIDHLIKTLQKRMPVCRRLQIPRPIQAFFAENPNCPDWAQLPEGLRQNFQLTSTTKVTQK